MKRLLKGGTVVSGKGCIKADLCIDGEKITEVGPDLPWTDGDGELVDVSGKLLFPGFIDGHTHFDLEVSNTVTADGFATGTRAAVSGGTTLIIDFATQNKGESLAQALSNWHKKSDGVCSCDYGFHMALSDWNPSVSQELEGMIREGITSFKLYMTYDAMVLNDKEIYQVLKRLKEVGGIAGVHCENKGIIDARIEEEKMAGHMGTDAHPRTRPAAAEAEAISRLLKIAALVDAPVIVVHLSSGAGYQEVKYARERGQEVILETCPQYLLLDESRYQLPEFEGGRYVIAPPLRRAEDQTRLWNALHKNHIQTIATDHCSFTLAQKEAGRWDFTHIPCGMPGVENRPVLIYHEGVLGQRITLEQMCLLLAENPAKLYGVYPQKGCLEPGSDADIVVWDPDYQWTIGVENQVSVSDYSPFEGKAVTGIAWQVYLRGQLTAQQGKVVQEGAGRYVARGKPMELA